LLQTTNGTCGRTGTADGNTSLLLEAACDTQVLPSACSPTDHYPRQTKVVMHHLPRHKLRGMPNPCQGVPRNPWCPSKLAAARGRR
jgi:hypothetical protein